MNLDELQRRLLAAARRHPPGDHVPYAFEQRVMARLRTGSAPRLDEWAAWARSLWCGAGFCTAVALLMSVWSFAPDAEQDLAASFAQDLERTILAQDDSENLW
jgi:hypothetical protein